MEAKFIIYVEDEEARTYCFHCAVAEIFQRNTKMDLAGRDYDFGGHDIRSDPTCCMCGKSVANLIDL